MKTSEETALIRKIRRHYGAESDLFLERNNVGVARELNEKSGDVRHVRYGLGRGSPDLVGMLMVDELGLAVWVAWEIKIEGEKPKGHQEDRHAMWRRNGALVFVADSLDEFGRTLREARFEVRERVKRLRTVRT